MTPPPSRPLLLATALALGLLALPATAKVSGHCRYEDRRVEFVDGVAWVVPPEPEDEDSDDEVYGDDDYDEGGDDYDEGGEGGDPPPPPTPDRLLAFTTFPLDAGAVARASDREDALREQGWEHDDSARLQLTLVPDAGVVSQQYLWLSPGTNLSYGSSEVGEYQASAGANDRVAGRYRYSDEDAEGPVCELEFDLALLGDPADAPPPPGVPLPPGGGEPGAVYLALNQAMRAGDIDALVKLLPPERAAELQKARGQPDFAEMLAFMQALTPEQVRITGGRQDGDRAWLEFTAVEAGQPRAGTAELRREAGRWQMVKESTRDPD